MRLLLVDDHPLFLEGLRNLLVARQYEVVGVAHDGLEALAQYRTLRPDLVLMDIRMPHCDGLAGARLIKAEFPDAHIVILTMWTDDDNLFEAIRLGVSGYLLKTQDTESFFRSLEELARGEVVMGPGLAQRVVKEFSRLAQRPPNPPAPVRLSPRQAQILALISRDMTYKEIGTELGLAERTVKYHMGEILGLLHLANRAEVEAYARDHGI